MAVVWLHGQIGFGSSESYEWSRHWFRAALEHYLEIASAIAVLVPALLQKTELPFLVAVGAAYTFDFMLETAYIYESRHDKDASHDREVVKAWISIDVIATVSITIIAGARLLPNSFVSERVATSSALVIVLLLTLWDYSRNRHFYFGLPTKHVHFVA